MRTLIIPDVHLKIDRVKKIIAQNDFDTLVSLGDWFDDFYDDPTMHTVTAKYILDLYQKYGEKFIWLLGNHDVPYVFQALLHNYWCSGNTDAKAKAVKAVFDRHLNLSNVQLCHIVEQKGCKPIIMSHAGVHKKHFSGNEPIGVKPTRVTAKTVQARCEAALMNSMIGVEDNLFRAGQARWGPLPVGGITWLDWNLEFEPINAFHQIVGHTPLRGLPMVTSGKNALRFDAPYTPEQETIYNIQLAKDTTYNINLDTHLRHYAVLYDATLKVFAYDAYE